LPQCSYAYANEVDSTLIIQSINQTHTRMHKTQYTIKEETTDRSLVR